ncbi:MAG TPA: hypothetical protein VFV50_19345 [Bdellovibrionales bacterium]|nr:hypothetical protein [Bdellovibrionales bacterium]
MSRERTTLSGHAETTRRRRAAIESRRRSRGSMQATREFSKPAETFLDVWRYQEQADFRSAQHVRLGREAGQSRYWIQNTGVVFADGGYRPTGHSLLQKFEDALGVFVNPAMAEVGSGSQGATLLERNQSYPLSMMERTGYISADVKSEQMKIAERLHPDQVTFFEVTEKRTEAELREVLGEVPAHARPDPYTEATKEYFGRLEGFEESDVTNTYHLKTGSAWLIAGQYGTRLHALGLESPGLSKKIDREKYRYVWEIGRGAKDRPNSFKEVIRAAALMALRELAINGGKLEDAYFFAHSLGELHTQLYQSVYKMTPYSGYDGKPNETALVIPLKELLKQVDLGPLLGAASLRSEAAPQAVWLQAFAKINANRYLDDPARPGQVLEIRDFSPSREELNRRLRARASREAQAATAHHADLAPSPELRDDALRYIQRSSYPYFIRETGETASREKLPEFLARHRAIEVSAGTPIEGDVAYEARRALVGAYRFYVRTLAAHGLKAPHAFMRSRGVTFAFSTSAAQVGSAVKSLKPAETWRVHQDALRSAHKMWWTEYRETLRPEYHFETHVFSIEQVAQWARELPEAEQPSLIQAYAQYRVMMSQADLLF